MEFNGIVENINLGENFQNITVVNQNKESINIKLSKEQLDTIEINRIYNFKTEFRLVKEKEQLFLLEALPILIKYDDWKELSNALKSFYSSSPIELEIINNEILSYINNIENEVIKKITKEIYLNNINKFLTYPAAIKYHHAFVGGLAYHTYNMLKASLSYMELYPFFNKDLVMGGIILHDIAKVYEFSSPINPSHSLEGALLGHLVIGSLMINETALKLNFSGKEEVLLLEHCIISHHGYLDFGSPKKPMIVVAVLIHLLDTMDSKIVGMKSELDQVNDLEFTNNVLVLDRTRIYKHNLKEKK